jgi:hypothetical protein
MLEEGVEVSCSGAGDEVGAELSDVFGAKVEVRVGAPSREGEELASELELELMQNLLWGPEVDVGSVVGTWWCSSGG